MIYFEKCPSCPVSPDLTCHAQRTGASHSYCRKIARGDAQARAVVLSRSQPSKPTPKASEPIPAPAPQPTPREAKPRMALGVPQKPPADCIPCQKKAVMRAIAPERPAG